jgi:hypothetical protein
MNSFTALLDEVKYNKDGSMEIKFIKQKVLQIKQKVLQIDRNNTIQPTVIEAILSNIKDIANYQPFPLSYMEGYINLDDKNLIKIFGTKNLNINNYYKIKDNIIITEFSEKVCIANPNIYAIKKGTILKLIKYTHYENDNNIVLQVRNVNKTLERNSLP